MNRTAAQSPLPQTSSAGRRGVEIEWLWLLILVALIYTTRIASPPIRGEESRRATATIYFLETGNWIVPQQQGNVLYMSARPPVQNWLMLGLYGIFHNMGPVTVRLPSILAVFGTVSLIYFYGRAWMSRLGAFTASLAFATMLQVMELGRTAETDLVLTFFLTAGLFGWHYYYEIRERPLLAWLLGYAAIALATLTKGPQAPVYFFAATLIYLSWTGRFRAFLDLRQVPGLCLYALIVGSWLVPYYLMTGKEGVIHIFTGDVGIDGKLTVGRVLAHLASFPVLLFGGLLPWSALLLLFFRRSVREESRRLLRPLTFAGLAFCFALLTVWLVIGSKTRFLLNMFPCAAICIGAALDSAAAVIERGKTAEEGDGSIAVYGDLRWFTRSVAGLAFLAALVFSGVCLAAMFKGTGIPFAMTMSRTTLFTVASVVLGFIMIKHDSVFSQKTCAASIFCVAAFFGLVYNLPVVDQMDRGSQRNDLAFQELYQKQIVPSHRTLVSIDECPHLINYLHYLQFDATIPKVTLAQIQQMRKTNDVYFVTDAEKFPLQYVPLAKLPLRRYRNQNGDKVAVIGKIPSETTP